LVVEPINGRDKVVEELMGDKAVGEMDSREEDKGEGRSRRGASFGSVIFLVYGKVRKLGEKKEKRKQFWLQQFCLQFCLRTLTRAPLLLGILGSGAKKPSGFLELWSRRGCS
jgi:hypothetical protein